MDNAPEIPQDAAGDALPPMQVNQAAPGNRSSLLPRQAGTFVEQLSLSLQGPVLERALEVRQLREQERQQAIMPRGNNPEIPPRSPSR